MKANVSSCPEYGHLDPSNITFHIIILLIHIVKMMKSNPSSYVILKNRKKRKSKKRYLKINFEHRFVTYVIKEHVQKSRKSIFHL